MQLDFGDSPAPYPTLEADDGARHQIGTVRLGTQVDGELDGQPHPQAPGDDEAGRSDEDGVFLEKADGALIIGANTTTNVLAANAKAARLNAWIDFNLDGDWADAGEHIFVDHQLDDSSNLMTLKVPPADLEGITSARFRLSTT